MIWIILFSVLGLVAPVLIAIRAYVSHQNWKKEFKKREQVYLFWKAQCEQASAEKNPVAFRVNLRRYEREVMGIK